MFLFHQLYFCQAGVLFSNRGGPQKRVPSLNRPKNALTKEERSFKYLPLLVH